MKKIKNLGRIMSMLLLAFIAGSITFPWSVIASVIDDSTSYHKVYDDEGNVVMDITMEDGEITIILKSHTAKKVTKYETIGLSITRKPLIEEKYTYKGTTYDGYKDINTVYKSGHGHIWFNKDDKKDVHGADGITTTTIKISAKRIEDALDTDFDDIVQGTPIYLSAIFDTYYIDDSGNKVILHGQRQGKDNGGIRDWETILKAEPWNPADLPDFRKYFSMEIDFQPAPQPNTLHYWTDKNRKIIDAVKLPKVKPGKYVYWDASFYGNGYKGKSYELYKYYVCCKRHPNVKIALHSIGDKDGCTIDDIAHNKIKERLGGLDIYLIYKPKKQPITPTPKPTLTSTPTGNVTPSPSDTTTPTPALIDVPEAESVTGSLDYPEAEGVIRADDRGSEKFTVTEGIPTTESLYTEVMSDNYLMGYDLEKQVGIKIYPVTVTKKYLLKWKGKNTDGSIKDMSETVTVKQVVSIQRAYGYWEVVNFDLYKIGYTEISNYALPNGQTIMRPVFSTGYNVPDVSINHSPSETSHIIVPDEITKGVELPTKTISSNTTKKPTVTKEDFTDSADELIPELNVKNDSLVVDGSVIMSDEKTEKEGPEVDGDTLSQIKDEGTEKCNEDVLYKPNQIIDAVKKNGDYSSSGTITYTNVTSVNSFYSPTIDGDIENLDDVVIHTPVLCDSVVSADNDKYVQLINPSGAVQLVLDPDSSLNDFNLTISNTGFHSSKQGYYTRDFSRSLRDPDNVSYLGSEDGTLLNEVKFPFDVYLKKSGSDQLIQKNTWIVMGRNTDTFYLPMWVQEGRYTAECRSIAVNADMSNLDRISEDYANKDLTNYVATNTFDFEVSGRIYGLAMYDLTDYPIWKEVFRVNNSLQLKINDQSRYPDGTDKPTYSKGYSYDYTVGTNDQYGKDTGRNVKYTFPLVDGNHPYYKNIGALKTGYVVRFKLKTIGDMYGSGCSVNIKPTFYWVDKNGNNRTQVDLYYEEEIDGTDKALVRVGSSLDKLNVKTMKAGSPYTGIPKEELKDTAALSSIKYSALISKRDKVFSFSGIDLLSTFRTFINKKYSNKILNSSNYSALQNRGITSGSIMQLMQNWYGCYYLPANLHVVNPSDVPEGLTVYQYAHRYGVRYNESFWKKDGYIIVNFDIVTKDGSGNERLSYINSTNYLNNGNNSMWVMEGAPLRKTDYNGTTFNWKAGDFIMYYVRKSVNNDYKSGGLY